MIKTIIAWDMGATKCTAGVVELDITTGQISCRHHATVKLTSAVSLDDLIHQVEAKLDKEMASADAICIGAAGQYDGRDLHHLAGVYPFPMPFALAAEKHRWPRFDVIHDYATLVCATFTSYMTEPRNIKRLNKAAINPHGRRVALGLGTGLGLKDGVLLPNGDFWLGKNEIGHIGVTHPPLADSESCERHLELMRFLANQPKTPHPPMVTFEKILTGKGIACLHQFLYPDAGLLTPEEAGARLTAGKTPELLALFAWYLGLLIGTVELTFMPEGGTWISGGVTLHHLNTFDQPAFFEGIQASPAYQQERAAYPLGVLTNPLHALIGGGYYAQKRLI